MIRQNIRTLILALIGALSLFFAFSGSAATDMLTAAGTTTAPTASTCPTGPQPPGYCTGGWFYIGGAQTAVVKFNVDAGTNTIVVEHRLDSGDATATLLTLANVGAGQTGYAVVPPSGWIRVRVTAIGGGGTVKAKLFVTNVTGGQKF
jgi:hypothetical protein